MDGDRDLDLVCGNTEQNSLYLNDGKGVFTLAPAAKMPVCDDPTAVLVLGDLDRDGDLDLSVIDDAKGLGDKKTFYGQLDGWADVLLITATSIINNSTETILSHAGPDLKIVLLGPSTPMIPEAFAHLPIHMLAGSAITEVQRALKIVRHSGGTRALKPVTRKIYWLGE